MIAESQGWHLLPCAYGKAEQEELINSTLRNLDSNREALNPSSTLLPSRTPSHLRQRSYAYAVAAAPTNLARIACQIKHPCFKAEKEIRLVREFMSPRKCDGFHPKGRLLVPHVEMRLTGGFRDGGERHPIREIVVGPGTDDEKRLNVDGVRKFLATITDRPTMNVRVRASQVPYRSD